MLLPGRAAMCLRFCHAPCSHRSMLEKGTTAWSPALHFPLFSCNQGGNLGQYGARRERAQGRPRRADDVRYTIYSSGSDWPGMPSGGCADICAEKDLLAALLTRSNLRGRLALREQSMAP
jgi:hypothetical protein